MDSGEQFGSFVREQSKNISGNKGDFRIFLGNTGTQTPWEASVFFNLLIFILLFDEVKIRV